MKSGLRSTGSHVEMIGKFCLSEQRLFILDESSSRNHCSGLNSKLNSTEDCRYPTATCRYRKNDCARGQRGEFSEAGKEKKGVEANIHVLLLAFRPNMFSFFTFPDCTRQSFVKSKLQSGPSTSEYEPCKTILSLNKRWIRFYVPNFSMATLIL